MISPHKPAAMSPDMIREILARLPPDSVLRFRCLSKSVCSEIDDSGFINQHIRRGSCQALTLSSGGQALLFDQVPAFPNKPAGGGRDVTSQVHPAVGSRLQLRGSCNGLIGLAVADGDGILIWNPYTRKYWIPSVPDVVYPSDEDLHYTSLGFGYDSLSDDYKVVRIVRFEWFDEAGVNCDVRVYSFKSNSWRQIGDSPHPFKISNRRPYGVPAFNALHFVATKTALPGINRHKAYVLAFDLHTEKFRNLAELPSQFCISELPPPVDVTVLGGQLCAVLNSGSGEIQCWVIKDYGRAEESWSQLFRVSLPWSHLDDPATLLEYSESDDKLLLHCNSGRFAWVDLESSNVEEGARVNRSLDTQNAILLVGSIASLSFGVGDNRSLPDRKVVKSRKGRFRVYRRPTRAW